MRFSLRFREEQFTPAEAARITGVPMHLQRDWRSQSFLPERSGGRASFTPHVLAKMRVMMKLRELGLALPDAHRNADVAANSVVYAALRNSPTEALGVEGPSDRADDFRSQFLDAETDHCATLAEMPDLTDFYRHALIQHGECDLVAAMDEQTLDETAEVAGVINLWAVAREFASATPRPFFTLVMPRG